MSISKEHIEKNKHEQNIVAHEVHVDQPITLYIVTSHKNDRQYAPPVPDFSQYPFLKVKLSAQLGNLSYIPLEHKREIVILFWYCFPDERDRAALLHKGLIYCLFCCASAGDFSVQHFVVTPSLPFKVLEEPHCTPAMIVQTIAEMRHSSAQSQLLEELETVKLAQELAAILELFQSINAETNIDATIKNALQTIQSLLDVEVLCLMLHDRETNTLKIKQSIGIEKTEQDLNWIPIDRGIEGHVFHTGQAMVLNDIEKQTVGSALFDRSKFPKSALVCAPLSAKGYTIGVVFVQHKNDLSPFSNHDVALIRTIASLTSVTIENARLYATLKKKQRDLTQINNEKQKLLEQIKEFNRELEIKVAQATRELQGAYEKLEQREKELNERVLELISMKEVGEAVSNSVDLHVILQLILNLALSHSQAEQGSIMMVDEETGMLTIEVAHGLSQQIIETTRIKIGEPIAGWVAEKGESLLVEDIESDPRVGGRKSLKKYRTKSLVCVPLKIQGKTIGVININNKIGGKSFDQDDLNILTSFAGQAALAVEKTRMQKDLEAQRKFIDVSERYLSKKIVDKIVKQELTIDLGGELREVTVMCCDMRGFSGIAERLPAEKVIELLNRFFGMITHIVFKYHGTLDKYTGDGLMAIFGAPITTKDDTFNAVNCAFEIIETVKQHFTEVDETPFHVGVGISSGLAIAGNIGSEQRMDYTVVGDVVNTAFRLEKNAGLQEIVISEETYRRVKDNVNVVVWGEQTLKGKNDKVRYFIIDQRKK